jgi:hypothetical protein
MESEHNFSEYNFIEQKVNPIEEIEIGVQGQTTFSPIANYSQNERANYDSDEIDQPELVLSIQSIHLTEISINSEEFKENITNSDPHKKIGNHEFMT